MNPFVFFDISRTIHIESKKKGGGGGPNYIK